MPSRVEAQTLPQEGPLHVKDFVCVHGFLVKQK